MCGGRESFATEIQGGATAATAPSEAGFGKRDNGGVGFADYECIKKLKIQIFSEIIINDPVLIFFIRMDIKAMRI